MNGRFKCGFLIKKIIYLSPMTKVLSGLILCSLTNTVPTYVLGFPIIFASRKLQHSTALNKDPVPGSIFEPLAVTI